MLSQKAMIFRLHKVLLFFNSINKGTPIEGFYVEIKLRKQKWLICCSYNANKHSISKDIETLSESIDLFSANYENGLLMVEKKNVPVHLKAQPRIYFKYAAEHLKHSAKHLK